MKHNYILLCGLLGASVPLASNAAVQINEIMVRNSSAIINENYNFEGWVELYNSGDENVNLSRYFFSGNEDDHFQWQNKANTNIGPKQYAVFYFDELDKDNHANFKLDCDGGVLILSDERGNEIDRITYPKTYRNTSYGRTQDGAETFGHFLTATMGKANAGAVAKSQSKAPVFSQSGGFYNGNQSITITSASPSATIYYTTNGSEPKPQGGMKYSGPININTTTVLRAIAVTDGEVSSDITTSTYFINNSIPTSTKVVSLATDRDYLFGDQLGALVIGTNGAEVPTKCGSMDRRANYMNDWDRPCNLELFDEGKVQRISQEVNVGVFGACSRTKPIKSIKVKANKVYGTNKLDYPIFNEKPNLKWKSFVLRNSGNDFGRMLFRDGFLQTLAASNMDIDHQAYEPAVVFVNGEYYGMLGIRERTNKDFVYSNYGLGEEEICIEETSERTVECDSYQDVLNIANNQNASYDEINKIIDVEELLNYFTTEIYYCNEDWSVGNIKAWKRLEDGKWRWILYDTDYSTSLYGDYLNTDGFTYAAKCNFFPMLKDNPEIKKRLMNKFTVHAGTTFAEEHVSAVMDSMINLVNDEADYFFNFLLSKKQNEASSWRGECEKVRNFITARPDYLFKHVSSNLRVGEPAPIRFCSDTKGASYDLNGLDIINKSDFRSHFFKGSTLNVKALAPDGYKFKEWEVCKEKYLLPSGSTWKYLYQNAGVSANWKDANFDDNAWTEGPAPLGAGLSYFVKTNISSQNNNNQGGAVTPGFGGGDFGGFGGGFGGFGGGDFGGFGGGGWGFGGTPVNTTSYLRSSFNVTNLSATGDLFCTMKANDGVVIYINGREAYRFNIPASVQLSDTLHAELDMDSYATRQFTIKKDFLVQGKNVIAVELHSANKSATLAFDIAIQDSNNALEVLSTSNQQNYSTAFSDSLTLRAKFVQDPAWSPTDVKLFLNEICIANKQYVDDFREDDDWIEIYNDGTQAVDLGGMFISDKRTNLTRYQIPTGYSSETTIPAKGYLILWADGDSTTQGPLHTNFQLTKKKSQTVTLSRMQNGQLEVIDSVRYEVHTKGNSYSRFSYEGNGAWALTSRPTFAARNAYAPDHSTSTITDLQLTDAVGFDIRVYPNPVDDYLWFSLGEEERATVSIMDYTGLQMKRETIANGSSIYVGDLKPSIYIVTVQMGQRTISSKFVKK
ncbi:MAG: CotH kinase family protein [Paludibacteraceae bacterium]|nr:CotH kinase family protein [Paludibacteraceae bacterium]